MKQTKTKEGNKLIAEFMELEKCSDPEHSDNPCYFINNEYRDAGNLQYHTSWDWQCPVWHKLYLILVSYGREDERRWNEAMNFVDNYEIHFNHGNIAGCHETIIEALTWHNQQTTTPNL